MATTRIHTSGPLRVTGSSAFNLMMLNQQVDTGTQMLINYASGLADPTHVANINIQPTISASTMEVGKALTNFTLDGLAIPNSTVFTTAEIYFAKVLTTAPRGGSSTHFKAVVNSGLGLIESINVNQFGEATANIIIHATWDGTNAPLVLTDSVSLPTSLAVSEKFTQGPVKINGTDLDGVQGMTINFGYSVSKVGDSGSIYPTRVHTVARQPSIQVQLSDIISLSTFGLTGTGVSSSTVAYLRKVANEGTTVANGTGEHISFTMTEGKVNVMNVGGQNNQDHGSTLVITPRYDGTNAIMQIATNATIS